MIEEDETSYLNGDGAAAVVTRTAVKGALWRQQMLPSPLLFFCLSI